MRWLKRIAFFSLMTVVFLKVVLFFNKPTFPRKSPSQQWMAIIGDSSVTGAVANPKVEADWVSLISHSTSEMLSPFNEQRVFYATHEMNEHFLAKLNFEALVSNTFDAGERSFAFLFGQSLGLKKEEIIIAAQNGAKIQALTKQFRRALEVGDGKLPPLALVSFVANDFCDPGFLESSENEFLKSYQEDLRKALDEIRQMPPNPNGTSVLFVEPLNVANLFENEDLRHQIVPFNGDHVSCQEQRVRKGSDDFSSWILKELLINECATVLDPNLKEKSMERIKSFQVKQSHILATEIKRFNQMSRNINAFYLDHLNKIPFQSGDLANDCFHPSEKGHRRIAEWLVKMAREIWPR